MTDFSISLPAKRRRGRPRKDGNLPTTLRALENPTLLLNKNAQRVPTTHPANNAAAAIVDDKVGSMIYGVVEGSFDAGYLISVKIGNNETPFRGVVFQPKKIVPLTSANDVAPQATMYQRQVDIKVPISPPPQKVDETTTTTTTTRSSPKRTDVFEPGNEPYYDNSEPGFMIRASSGGGEMENRPREEAKDVYYVRGDFHQQLFTGQSEPHQSPTLKFDLQSCTGKSPMNHLGYHHALVSGNPLLLPPEFSGEPLELMMEKKQTIIPKNETSTTELGGGTSHAQSDMYKLELATPRPTIESNCIADMDFVLSDVVQHTENQGEHCQTKK